MVSFGAGGKSNMFSIWAMWETWIRSRMFIPFFMAWIGSPLKYAVRCSNSVKSSTERRLRLDPTRPATRRPARAALQEDCRRKLGQERLGQVELDVVAL